MAKTDHKRKYFITRILPVLLLFVFFSGARFGGGDDDIYTQINKNMDIFGRVYREVALNYVDEVIPDKFMQAGIDGMLNTLDPYTNFIDASRKDEVDLLTTGKYGGVGISIAKKDSGIIITDVMEGYSAQREGIKSGDMILEIDGVSMEGKNPGDVRTYVKGPTGTQLKMKIKRGERILDFTLTREEIQLKNVTYKGMLEGGIGYIKLERFSRYAANEIADALTELKSKGELKGVILDLRDNPGGLMDAAVSILNKFVDKGSLVLTTRGRKLDSEKKFFSVEEPMLGKDVPIVLLVNQNTASASEIVAGAIQDLDRGVLVGTKTFGKGLVQVIDPLSYDDQLKITTQKYFTPSGRWIQAKNYFKENKYGVFKPDPYYNQTTFKTLDGRTVYAEGGITPDTIVNPSANNELLEVLNTQDMYYRFADKYVSENPDVNGFVWNDNIINSFYNFLTEQNFDYTSKAEKDLADLKLIVADKKYSDKTRTYVADLETELKSGKLADFDVSKPQIKAQLITEILKKYGKSDKEITDATMSEDTQIQAALSVIKDRQLYNSFLSAAR
ncbi:MAG: S41 family peptidase [Ignavibacteria bacterium]|jgi:carboxyl-terminal processing protease